jgi:hypothetical protein
VNKRRSNTEGNNEGMTKTSKYGKKSKERNEIGRRGYNQEILK